MKKEPKGAEAGKPGEDQIEISHEQNRKDQQDAADKAELEKLRKENKILQQSLNNTISRSDQYVRQAAIGFAMDFCNRQANQNKVYTENEVIGTAELFEGYILNGAAKEPVAPDA